MAEEHLQQFLAKIEQLNAFVGLCQSQPELLQSLRDCNHHQQVVDLARSMGFDIARRWGDPSGAENCGGDKIGRAHV